MAEPKKTQIVGLGCEFVEKPPIKFIQSECPVCLQIKTETNCCPTCNEENFVTFHDKRLQRSLYEIQVYYSHKQEGCDWKGELGQLDNHLNLSPQPDKQLLGCKYSEIECIYCSELIKRDDNTIHQGDHCPKRPFSCEYCHSYESHYEDVIHNHWPVCDYHPVRCPNECGKLPQRQALENHITRDCPNTVIDCDFCHAGCDVRLPRTDMPAHLVAHMSLQAASHSKLIFIYNGLQGSYKTLLTSHKELQDEVRKLKSEKETLKQHVSMAKFSFAEFTMENFEQHKKDKDIWYSPPFYTGPGGYRFCLSVEASGNGSGEGTHISVFICLMRGEFDDHLKFPFRGDITVQLVAQEGGEKHTTWTIPFSDRTPDKVAGRVTEGERQENGWGKQQFISHGGLKPKYLRDDCLCFRVPKVELK